MSEKRKSNATKKLKNFLVTGSMDDTDGEETDEMFQIEEEDAVGDTVETYLEEPVLEEEVDIEEYIEEPEDEPNAPCGDTTGLEAEIAELKEMISSLRTEMERYATSKEQLKEYTAVMNKRDQDLSNRKFMGMLEHLSAMREDFFKLCKGMESNLESFTPKDVLRSFEAYGVDMENILTDCGVFIGPFKYEKLNTIHQRIVGIIPTDDESLNGMIAERLSDGYEYGGRVLHKEKVSVYKFTGKTENEEKEE